MVMIFRGKPRGQDLIPRLPRGIRRFVAFVTLKIDSPTDASVIRSASKPPVAKTSASAGETTTGGKS